MGGASNRYDGTDTLKGGVVRASPTFPSEIRMFVVLVVFSVFRQVCRRVGAHLRSGGTRAGGDLVPQGFGRRRDGADTERGKIARKVRSLVNANLFETPPSPPKDRFFKIDIS